MLFPVRTLVICLLVSFFASATIASADTLADAHRDLEVALLKLRLYRQVEHPAEQRRLRSDIQITRAEVAALERRLREYEPLDRWIVGSAVRDSVERAKLDLLAAKLHLQDLTADLSASSRFYADRLRLLQLTVEQAAARVALLEKSPH